MESRQSECATLSQPHYAYLANEVQKNGLESAISNRTNGIFPLTESAKRDIEVMREIAAAGS